MHHNPINTQAVTKTSSPAAARSYRTVLQIVFVLAVVARLVLGYAFSESFHGRGNRSSGVVAVAEVLAQSGEFAAAPGQPTAQNAPVYTAFIAVIFLVFGNAWLPVAFFQALISVLNGFVIYRLSLLLFQDTRAAVVAAIAVLFYPFYLTQSISVSETVLFCCLVALSTYYLALATLRDDRRWYVMAGVAWGVTYLTKQTAAALFIPALMYPYFHHGFKRASARALLVACIAGAVLLPWVARNYVHSGKMLISTHGSIELWFAYNDRTTEALSQDVSVDVFRRDRTERLPVLQELDRRSFRTPIEREVAESDVFIRAAVDYARAHPQAVIGMMPLKFWKFWSWFKNPKTNSLNPNASTRLSRLWDLSYTVSYFPLLVLGMAGLASTWRRGRRHVILVLLILGYTAFHTVIYGFSRLRLPIDQFLMVYGGVVAVWVWSALRAARRNAVTT